MCYKRKYRDGDDIKLHDLREAHRMAARMVADGGDDYLLLFERLEDELLRHERRTDIKARALEVAGKQNERHSRRHSPKFPVK